MNRFVSGTRHLIRVKPQSKKNEIVFQNEDVCVRLNAPAIDGKANEALVRFFKKQLNCRIEIVRGHLTPTKLIQIL